MPETKTPETKKGRKKIDYKWVALSNTTLGMLLASIDSTIILISMPEIFKGMHLNPLAADGTAYMMWMIMGYMMVTATLLVSFGRISDIFGRVRLYNLGFAIYTGASLLLFLTPGIGPTGMTLLIAFRLLQAVGAGFIFSNSAAIITDAFEENERGFAMSLNMISLLGGNLIGLILGGILAAIHWRLIFLISVPVGLFGTVWGYLKLKEQSDANKNQKIDWAGNSCFAVGLTIFLIAATYGIMPYGNDSMGWSNPMVIWGIIIGLLLIVVFVFIEFKVPNPMFKMSLFRIRAFTCGNFSRFLASVAQGGLQFMLVIWLQGIWLPLHGYTFDQTPLWSGIYLIPTMIGFLVMGVIGGKLSDKYGPRAFTTIGMLICTVSFMLLDRLPVNFSYLAFFWIILVYGIGGGLFSAPNTAAVMNSVPARMRGVSSGMRSTFQNTGSCISMTVYFAILIYGMSKNLPTALLDGLKNVGISGAVAEHISKMPPNGALFAAFLGYNPMQTLIGPDLLNTLPEATRTLVLSEQFFPKIISPAIMSSLKVCFYISAFISLIAAGISFMRGSRDKR